MSQTRFNRLSKLTAVVSCSICLFACSRDPGSTALPLNLADIPKIQSQLDKLPAPDKVLVLAYLTRSNGDVLPEKFADPDAPLTARTFSQAIKLQKAFEVKQSANNVVIQGLRDDREASYAPLRKALSIQLLKREILGHDEATGRKPQPGEGINNHPVLVTTYRLQNHSGERIEDAAGSVTVRAASDPQSLLGLDHCYLTGFVIADGQSLELRCAGLNKMVGQAHKDYVELPESSLAVTWEPKMIRLASGKVLKFEN
jgi:hypothetical protein